MTPRWTGEDALLTRRPARGGVTQVEVAASAEGSPRPGRSVASCPDGVRDDIEGWSPPAARSLEAVRPTSGAAWCIDLTPGLGRTMGFRSVGSP